MLIIIIIFNGMILDDTHTSSLPEARMESDCPWLLKTPLDQNCPDAKISQLRFQLPPEKKTNQPKLNTLYLIQVTKIPAHPSEVTD